VLEEPCSLTALGAAHHLEPVHLQLVGAGAREAEGRHAPRIGRLHRYHGHRRAEGAEAGLQGAADPLIRPEKIVGAGEIAGGGGDAVGDLELRTLVEDGAAAGGTAHETDAHGARRVHVHPSVQPLAIAQRDGGGVPGEEAEARRRIAAEAGEQQRLVQRHVGGAVERLGDEQPEVGAHPCPGVHLRTGWRAASVWSSRRTAVVTGASWSRWGLVSASRAIWIMASQN
jgi:hypothetical protein